MSNDPYPEPVSDPQASGLPDTADDDSTAWDDVDSGREADGPDPAALPADRPMGLDEYGTTPGEARAGEPLDRKLGREVPDPALRESGSRPDTDVAGAGTSRATPDEAVSMYDTGEEEKVGRLVEPDEGAPSDTEADAIASDAGAAGGGPSAEELAMHPVEEE
jgi:Family of unknown function (DUF5709)